MCLESSDSSSISRLRIDADDIWTTSDGSLVGVLETNGYGPVECIVVASANPAKNPVGTTYSWKNRMGHVLCAGNDEDHQDECLLHPLDAKRYITIGGDLAHHLVKLAKDGHTTPIVLTDEQIEAIAEQEAKEAREREAVATEVALLSAENLALTPDNAQQIAAMISQVAAIVARRVER